MPWISMLRLTRLTAMPTHGLAVSRMWDGLTSKHFARWPSSKWPLQGHTMSAVGAAVCSSGLLATSSQIPARARTGCPALLTCTPWWA